MTLKLVEAVPTPLSLADWRLVRDTLARRLVHAEAQPSLEEQLAGYSSDTRSEDEIFDDIGLMLDTGDDGEAEHALLDFYLQQPYPGSEKEAAEEPWYLEAVASIKALEANGWHGFLNLVEPSEAQLAKQRQLELVLKT